VRHLGVRGLRPALHASRRGSRRVHAQRTRPSRVLAPFSCSLGSRQEVCQLRERRSSKARPLQRVCFDLQPSARSTARNAFVEARAIQTRELPRSRRGFSGMARQRARYSRRCQVPVWPPHSPEPNALRLPPSIKVIVLSRFFCSRAKGRLEKRRLTGSGMTRVESADLSFSLLKSSWRGLGRQRDGIQCQRPSFRGCAALIGAFGS
jgi:hypothetical protein